MIKKIVQNSLKNLSKKIIQKYQPEIIGITGSIGKTSAKEAVATILATKFKIRSNYKNYNNEIGLPLTIIGIDKTPGKSILGWMTVFAKAFSLLISKDPNYPEKLVLEMGSDKPGDIAYLIDIAPCKVGVLTYISHAHTEFFKSLNKIALEKRVIISHLKKDGFAILNFDNSTVMEQLDKTKAQVLTYGFKEGADFRVTDVNVMIDLATEWPKGLNFKISHKGSIVPVYLPGQMAEHIIPSALAGIAVGYTFGINIVDSVNALRNLKPLAGHMRLISGVKNTLIIDDTYNSSPDPVKSALKTLANINIKQGAEKYVVLGDMLELGGETENLHREIGMRVAEHGIDFLITVGEASKHTASAALEAGLGEHQIASFDNSVTAGRFLQEKLDEGDVVLVKGSQGSRMEKIVKEVMAEPLEAEKLLVRQGEEWQKR